MRQNWTSLARKIISIKKGMTMQIRMLGWLLFMVGCGYGTQSHAANPEVVQGIYDSPFGRLLLSEKDGEVRAKTVAAGGPCNFRKGQVLLEGKRLEDNITGTWNICQLGKGCAQSKPGWVMLLVTKSGSVLSGAIHQELTPGCRAPVATEALSLQRVVQPEPPKNEKSQADRTSSKKVSPPKAPPVMSTRDRETRRKQAEATAAQAALLLDTGAIEAAREKFHEAVKLDPGYSEGYVGIGVTYYMRDRYDEALDFYKKSLEANPGNRDAYYNTACVYALKGEPEQALRYLKIAVLNGYISLETLSGDPDLKSLRDLPEFKRLQEGRL